MFTRLRVEDSTSGLNSRANSESEMSYSIRTHGSDLRRLLSLEQMTCSGWTLGGCTHVTRPAVSQITNRVVNVNISFCYEEYAVMHFVYRVCNGKATAAVIEYGLWYPRRRIPDRRMFICVHQHQRKFSFPGVNRFAEKYNIAQYVGRWKHYWHGTAKSTHKNTKNFCSPLCSVHGSFMHATHRRNISVPHPAHSAFWAYGHV